MKTTPSKRPRSLLSPKACHELLGSRIGSLDVSLLFFQLNAFLKADHPGLAKEILDIPSRLLAHNASPRRHRQITELLPIDADVVFDYDAVTKRTQIDYKAYFANRGFERPRREQRVVLHIRVRETDRLQRSVSVPLQALMTGYGDVNDGHQGYVHSITFLDEDGRAIEQWYYVGITSRNWLERMEEHMHEIRTGSGKRFHAAWRAYAGDSKVMLGSELVVLNHSFVGIMDWEEVIVDQHMAAGISLNMIPGGFKGLKFLHEHRITPREKITLAERDLAIAKYVRTADVKIRVPNLLLSKLWETDEFYLKVLAGRSDVLTPAQVLRIRQLAAEGSDEQAIADIVGARNVQQIRRVLAGKTYRRVT